MGYTCELKLIFWDFGLKAFCGLVFLILLTTAGHANQCRQFLQLQGSARIHKTSSSALLLSSTPPSFEDLIQSFGIEAQIPTPNFINNENFNLELFRAVLKIFKITNEDADYYFVGNGFYIPYLIAKSLFSGTILEDRIKFMPLSRPSVTTVLDDVGSADRFFETLGLGHHQRNLILIDSVSYFPKYFINANSLLKLHMAVMEFLKRQKSYSHRQALATVIAAGYTERQIKKSPDGINTMFMYKRRMQKFLTHDFRSTQLPFYRLGDADIFLEFYSRKGTSHNWEGVEQNIYWNGKYNYFDDSGMPLGKLNLEELLANGAIEEFQSEINQRLHRLEIYRYIISAGNDLKRGLLKKEVQKTLRNKTF